MFFLINDNEIYEMNNISLKKRIFLYIRTSESPTFDIKKANKLAEFKKSINIF